VSVPSNDTQLVADGVSEQDKAGPRQLIRINKYLDQVKINVTTVVVRYTEDVRRILHLSARCCPGACV